jgi:tetratricopeptide (TPR) repeat protein
LTFFGFHGLAPSLEIFPKARAAALKALQIDPTLPDANISMGYVKLYHDWNWIEAEYYLRRAIELNPSSAKAYYSLMLCLVQSGRFEPGRAALQKALDLDPFNMLYHTSSGWLEYYAKRPRVAIEKLEEALALDPTYPELQVALGVAHEQLGLFKQAIEYMESAAGIYGTHPLVQAFLGSTYASAKETGKAFEVIATLDQLAQNRFVPSVCWAIVYMSLEDDDRAFEYLKTAAEAREPFLCWLNVLPVSESMRADSRFADLLCQIGFDKIDR